MREDAFVPLALALVGQEFDAPVAGAGFVTWLASLGWDAPAVQELRRQRQADELPWPFPVEPATRAGVGAAQFHALLAQARADLGVDGLVASRRVGPPVLGPAEQRLLLDRPPHHGTVG